MNIWLVMIAGGLLTFATRLSFFLLLARMDAPQRLLRALRFVMPAVLAAIIFPEVLLPTGQPDFGLENFRLLAALLATLVAWRTGSVLLTIASGMLALLVLQAVFG